VSRNKIEIDREGNRYMNSWYSIPGVNMIVRMGWIKESDIESIKRERGKKGAERGKKLIRCRRKMY
jgi:hypothetical protein